MAIYTYYKSTDFPAQKVAPGKLHKEIAESSITVDLNGITTQDSEDEVYLDFDGTLSPGDISILDSIVAAHDGDEDPAQSSEIISFLDVNTIVTDPVTSLFGPFFIMQLMLNRKALYNDNENPLYEAGYTPLLGEVGSVPYLLSMHEKTGWHRIELMQARYVKPRALLIYYGYPNSFNYSDNSWNNELVAQDMAKYSLIVLGGSIVRHESGSHTGSNGASTLEDTGKSWETNGLVGLTVTNSTDGSSGTITANTATTVTATLTGGTDNDWDTDDVYDIRHPDYTNASTIISRVKALNPNTKIFGYVKTPLEYTPWTARVNEWDAEEVHGIFMDESGYDYGTTSTNSRTAFNSKVDFVHGKTNSNLCFVNSWNMDHVLGTVNDASYPNTTWNPSLVESNLTWDDYYLLESFTVNTSAYSANNGYESKTNWAYRGAKAIAHRYTYGINLVGSGIISNGNANGSDLFNFGFISALMLALEAFGTSDEYYGASSAEVDWWSRPDVSDMGLAYEVTPVIQVDAGDSDVYHRYVEFGKLSLDFSTGAQSSSITKY